MKNLEDKLAEALRNILGDRPDRYGYGAAANVMDDGLRAEAREALAAYEAQRIMDAQDELRVPNCS